MPFAAENRLLSWYHFLSTFLLVVGGYAGIILFQPVFVKLAAGILTALLMTRMFVIYHDFQHGAIFRRSRIMKIFMNFFGIVALAPVSIWDESHEHHHHNNSKFSTFVVGSFPVVSTTTYQNLSKAGRRKYLLIRHPLMILFAYVPIFLVSFCLWPFFENPKKYWDCGVAAVVHIMIAAALYMAGGFSMVLFTLLIPCFLMYAIGGYIFYAQHNFPKVVLRSDPDWSYLDAALNSSGYIKMSRLMHWFTANHHIHHVNPRIPFYRLPEVMKAFPELQHPRETSLRPGEVWRCLRLKLWDEKADRLITISEYKEVYTSQAT